MSNQYDKALEALDHIEMNTAADPLDTHEIRVALLAEGGMEAVTDDRTLSLLSQAVKAAYRKHALDDPRIGWDELHTILADAIVAEMGDNRFCEWLEQARQQVEQT